MRAAIAAVVALASASVGLPASAADSTPWGQTLQWANGTSFTSVGANATLTIDQGTIEFVNDCPSGFNDFMYPYADVYIVPAGGMSDGASLSDVSGSPNTVQGASGGLFISETIAYTAPSGTLGTGTYAVVYDECQNGKYDEDTDALFDPAIQVEVPPDVPPLPSIAALKASADDAATHWAEVSQQVTVLLNFLEVFSLATGNVADALMYLAGTAAGLYLPDVKLAAITAVVNTAKYYRGIANDPPDPAFAQATVLPARPQLDVRLDVPLAEHVVALGGTLGTDAALTQALLHSLERYQGADLAADPDWALVHARAIRDHALSLATHLDTTDAAIAGLTTALTAETSDLDGFAADLELLRQRIVTDGLTAEEQARAAALGITTAEVESFRTELAAQDHGGFSEAALLTALDAIRATNTTLRTDLAALATDIEPTIASLAADPAVHDPLPVADAGGIYAVDEGVDLTLDASASSGSPTPLTYDWDLDGDGAFDDATGASPTTSFGRGSAGLAGVQVTDGLTRSNVGYAPLTVREVDRPATIADWTPASGFFEVEVGATALFDVTASDPEGATPSVTWTVDGVSGGTGASFAFTPTSANVGLRAVEVVADDGTTLGGSATRTWQVAVVEPDADGDGWRANVDCDDSDAAVNPGATEVVHNGVDDDCDPATSDLGGPPTPAFVPVGQGANVALAEAGASIAASSGTPFSGHTPQEMIDFGRDDLPWASHRAADEPYAIVALADGPVAIDRVQVRPRFDYVDQRVRDFAVDVSTTTTDPAAFTTVLLAATADSAALQTFALPETVVARYVRYRPLSNHGGGYTCGGCISTHQFRVLSPQQQASATVAFVNGSVPTDAPVVSYLWDFGDGTTSTDANPTHTFPGPGTYQVSLTATDADGQAATTVLNQQVLELPQVAFGFSDDAPLEGSAVQLLDGSVTAPGTTLAQRAIDWGDGSRGGASTRHIYRDDATYTVTLEVLDSAGNVGVAQVPLGVVNAPPQVEVGPDTTWVAGPQLQLDRYPNRTRPWISDPGTADTWTCSWDYGDGSPASSSCTFDHAYSYTVPWGTVAAPLTFTPRLTVTDDDGATVTDSFVLSVRPRYTPSSDNLVTNGDFESPSAGGWFTTLNGTSLTGWKVEYGTIDLISTYFADAASGAQSVDIDGSSISAINQTVTTEPGATYRLRFAVAGNIEGPSGVRATEVYWGDASLGTVTFDTTGHHRRTMGWRYEEFVLTATSTETLVRLVSRTEGVYGMFVDDVSVVKLEDPPSLVAPIADAGGPYAADEGATVTLDASGSSDDGSIVSYAWDLDGDGVYDDGSGATAEFLTVDDGTFPVSVLVTDDDELTATADATVTVTNVTPTVAPLAVPSRVEPTEEVMAAASFTDPGAADTHIATFEWGDGSSSPGVVDPVTRAVSGSHTYAASGSYTVTLTVVDDDGGQHAVSAGPVVVNHAPEADAGGPYTVPEGSTVTLAGSARDGDGDVLTYLWDPADRLTGAGSLTPTYAGVDDTVDTLTLTATDPYGARGTATTTVTVTNVAPSVVVNGPTDPQALGTVVTVTGRLSDPGVADTHTGTVVWDDGSVDTLVLAADGTFTASHAYGEAGIFAVRVEVTDDDGSVGLAVHEYAVVYDPDGGFVTGGGHIDSPPGAYVADPAATGRASFGFVAKYQKGAHVPSGHTQFQFRAGDLTFSSTAYEWLVVSGQRAQYKGIGTVNGTGDHGFLLTAVDDSPDRFRIKIWDRVTGDLVYDNQVDASDDAPVTTALTGGSIVIHTR